MVTQHTMSSVPRMKCPRQWTIKLTQVRDQGSSATVKCAKPPRSSSSSSSRTTRGTLKDFGYKNVKDLTLRERRKALRRAVARHGKVTVQQWLKRLETFNSVRNPTLANIFRLDHNAVQRNKLG